MPGPTVSAPLVPRIFGALSLRQATFAGVAVDPGAGFQAGLLMILIGTLEAVAHAAGHELETIPAEMLITGIFSALIGWMMWSVIVWAVACRGFGHDGDLTAAVRVVAFAHAPALLYGFGALNVLAPWLGLIRLVTFAWFIAALFAAIRGWLGLTVRRAALLVVVVFAVWIFVEEVLPWAFRLVPLGT